MVNAVEYVPAQTKTRSFPNVFAFTAANAIVAKGCAWLPFPVVSLFVGGFQGPHSARAAVWIVRSEDVGSGKQRASILRAALNVRCRFLSMFRGYGGTPSIEGMIQDRFPTAVASKLSGVSQKTLENWDLRGFLNPSIQAARAPLPRIYSFRDLIAIRVAARLRDDGIALQSIRRVVDYLRARKGLSSTAEILAGTSLVTDGHDVFEVEKDAILSALRRPGQRTLHVVPFDEVVTEIQTKARALRAA